MSGGDVDEMEDKTTDARSIAVNLHRLRTARRLTRKELAAKVGLSRVVIREIERGAFVPLCTTLDGLAKALTVPLGDLVMPVRPLEHVRFSARTRVHASEQVLATVSTWLDAYIQLETWLERLQGDKPPPFRFRSEALSRLRTPIETAQDARQAAGLGSVEPVSDLPRLLEENGVKVLVMEPACDSLFGLSVGPQDRGPAVAVNGSSRVSVEGWKFAAARELGHLLLHPSEYGQGYNEYPMRSAREADAFAIEFLMPDAAFAREWEKTGGDSLPERVLKVKQIFGVSYRVVLWRLLKSGRDTSDVWRRFHRQLCGTASPEPFRMDASGWTWKVSEEPAGLSRNDFAANRLSWLVGWAVKRNTITLGRAAEILKMTREELRKRALQWVS